MATEVPAWIHFQVPARPGAPGLAALGLRGNVAALPDVLRRDMATGAGTWVFACDPKKPSGPQDGFTTIPWLITCAACRRTPAHAAALRADPGPRAAAADQEPPVNPHAPPEAVNG